jgi:8-oxo-dGTP diphosphatase
MATSIAPAENPVIKAAGGIIQRVTEGGDEVLLVFRKQQRDWTLPKGEVKDGESFQEAALREVEQETGCSCQLGGYLGTISYADNGVPKVVMFWKMSVLQEKSMPESKEIGEAAWMQVPAAIQRLSHSQEKALLSHLGTAPRLAQPSAETEPQQILQPMASQPQPQLEPQPSPRPRRKASLEDQRVLARLLREAQAFRVELAFLERRSGLSDKSWAAAAHDQIDNVMRCLDSNDIEGGLVCLNAAQRFAVYGLNKSELATRAAILREEALKITSWRGNAMETLLSVPDEQITADRLADAMKLRDEFSTDQYYRTRLAGDHLRILLIICALAVVALLPFMLLTGPVRMVAPVLLFGLLGSSFSAAHSLMTGKNGSMVPNVVIMLTPVLFGAVAGLAGYAIHEYLVTRFSQGPTYLSALFALAFLFGMLGQRLLARFSINKRRKRAKA